MNQYWYLGLTTNPNHGKPPPVFAAAERIEAEGRSEIRGIKIKIKNVASINLHFLKNIRQDPRRNSTRV